ncbi:MAG: formylglycine-generating enzyme family protein [Bacteroidota bacterium]|nr:formylglycine-generating enzyme family protein [Bacteroidota bacterium]
MDFLSRSLCLLSPLLLLFFSCEHKKEEIGMVYFEGGKATFGCVGNNCKINEIPQHQVHVKSFYLQKSPVTVAEFRAFVKVTDYKTDAERFGNSGVFDLKSKDWIMVDGANWEYPFGKNKDKSIDNHPVTQVSWNDACAYCAWKKMRLPTEEEWEFAARFNENEKYSWGVNATTNGKWNANAWQGVFPDTNTIEDGFLYTSPVGYFGENNSGLTDMGGNVWQWCSNTYTMYPNNPEPIEMVNTDKVIRGGSFLCDSNVCHGYQVFARNFCSSETSLIHLGFRCAKDEKP